MVRDFLFSYYLRNPHEKMGVSMSAPQAKSLNDNGGHFMGTT